MIPEQYSTFDRMTVHYPDLPNIRWIICPRQHIAIENLSARPDASGLRIMR